MSSRRLQSIGLHFSEILHPSKLEAISLCYADGERVRKFRGTHWKSNARTDILAAALAILKLRDTSASAPGEGTLESARSEAEADLCARLHDLWHSPRKRVESHWLDAVFDRETRELASPLGVILRKAGSRKSATIRLAPEWTGDDVTFFRGKSSLTARDLRAFLERHFGMVDPAPEGPSTSPLRRYRTSFVGRTSDLAELRSLKRDHRFVSLIGPAGAGKTRLAVELAREESDSEVFWVDLSGAMPGDDIAQHTPQATADQVLGDRHALLILDNCELVLDEVREFAEELLRSNSGTVIVATSVEPIGVHGETSYSVRPFPVPAATDEGALAADCVQLFLDRARAAGSPVAEEDLKTTDLRSVLDVCRAVGGLPLGIELAAPASGHYPLDDLAELLAEHTEFLASPDRTVPKRHETLFSVLSWTFQSLTERERSLFLAVAAFPTDWTLATVLGIFRRLSIDEAETLRAHTRLAELSIVRIESRGRFSMLQPLRSFARTRTKSPPGPTESEGGSAFRTSAREQEEYARFLAAFEEHYLEMVECPQDGEHPDGGPTSSLGHAGALAPELPNCHAAAFRSLATGRPEVAVRFVRALFSHWISTGRWRDGVALCRRVLMNWEISDASRAQVLWTVGGLEFRLGDITQARGDYESARDLSIEADVDEVLPHALHGLGAIAFRTARLDEAEGFFEQALAKWSPEEDQEYVLLALNNLAAIAGTRSDFDTAAERFAIVVEKAKRMGDDRTLASGLLNLGLMRWRMNAAAEARQLFARSLEIWERIGDSWGQSMSANNLAVLALAEGDLDSTRRYHAQSLMAREELEDLAGIAASLEGFASLALAEERPARAIQLMAAANTLRLHHEIELTEENRRSLEEDRVSAERSLSPPEAETARQIGNSLDWREAVILALGREG